MLHHHYHHLLEESFNLFGSMVQGNYNIYNYYYYYYYI